MKKLISILLILAFLPCQIFAQDNVRVVNIIPSAQGGLKSHINPYLTPEDSAVEATNIRCNNSFGSVSSREVLVSEVDMGSASVNSLYRYYISSGTQYTVASTSTLLRYDASGTATTLTGGISSALSDGKKFQFVTYKDIMIASNGYELPLKWDGVTLTTANTTAARTAGDLMAELGAPFATLITGTGQTAAKWYQYRMAFYDGTTYSYSTARSNPILTGAAVYSIRLTNIPLGPTGTTHRYIYRSQANSSRANCIADTTYKMVKDLADNSTIAWTDIVADGAEPNVPTWATVSAGNNATPPKSAILEICTERLFTSGNTTAGYQSDVYWSDDGNPDYFSPSSLILVRPDDGDKVTFLKTFLGILTIGKTNTIQKFYTEGNPGVDWLLSNPFSFVGCPAPYTAAVTPLGIFYLGRHGLYRFSGQSSELISDVVTKEIEDISQVNISDTCGIYWNNEYHLAYASSASSSATNNRDLVYDIVRNAYVLDTKNVASFAAFGSGTDYGTLFSGSSTTDGYVFAHSPTTYTFLKRYKSELDAGTFSSTASSGTEDNPILSILTLDNMESYTSNTLVRASWIPSEKTAGTEVPPDLGSGVDGSKTVSVDESLTAGVYNYTDLTIDAGITATATGGTIKCLGTVTVNGTLICDKIYAHTVTVGAAGAIQNATVIKANTLNNAGSLATAGSGTYGSSTSGSWYVWSPADFNVSGRMSPPQGASGTASGYVEYTFPSQHINSVSHGALSGSGSDGSGSRYGAVQVGGTTIASVSSSGIGSSTTPAATVSTGWDSITSLKLYVTVSSSYGVDDISIGQTTWTYTPLCYYKNSSGTVPTSGSVTDFVYALDVFSENTITNEAEYSLKCVVPAGADTLNENITKTISDTDLSGITYILVDVYASRSGTQMQLGLGEGSLTDFVDIPVSVANTWETVKIDISGIANANIDHCTRVGIKFTNTTVGNVVYLDNIKLGVTTSSWTSPVYQINAESLKKLYWNENLNTYGDVTWAIRTGATTPVDGTWSGWTATEYTNPNGSAITDTANTYIQFRVTLTTSDTTTYLYPWLYQTDSYLFKINYSKIGANYETSVNSKWTTGFRNIGNATSRKFIKKVWVYYSGEAENLTVNILGSDPNISQSFIIDMSVLPNDSYTDNYYGTPNNKIYVFTPPVNSETTPSLISEEFQFSVQHEGDEPWKVSKMKVLVSDEPVY